MTLRARLYLLICFLILGSASVLYLTSCHVLQGGFAALEIQTTQAKVARAVSAVDDQLSGLLLTASDYGQWDDTYTYAHDANPEYIKDNLQPSYLRQVKMHTVIIANARGKVLIAISSLDSQGNPRKTPQRLLRKVADLGHLTLGTNPSGRRNNVVGIGHQVFLVASVPIRHSDGSGPVAGRMIFIREIDRPVAQELNKITTLDVNAISYEDVVCSPHLSKIGKQLLQSGHTVCEFTDASVARGYALFRTGTGMPSAILQIATARDVHAQAAISSRYLLIITIAFTIVFAALTVVLWNRTIFRRLARLSLEIEALKSGDTRIRMSGECDDEITAVARLINSTLDRLDESQSDLKIERERLVVTLASIGDAVVATDADARITFINRAAERVTGWTQAQASGRGVSEVLVLLSEDTREHVQNPVFAALERRSLASVPSNTLLVRRDGSEVPIDDRAAPIVTQDGQLLGSVIVFRDVSEQRAADVKLRESEARLKTLWHSIYAGVVIVDAETHEIVDVNDAAAGMIGRARNEIIGKVCHGYMCPAAEGKCPIPVSATITDCADCILLTGGGDPVDIMKTVVRIQLDGRPYLLETFVDISDRKRAEEMTIETAGQLEESLARNKAILESSAVGIMVTEGQMGITEANSKMAEICGCSVRELAGSKPQSLFVSNEDFLSFVDYAAPILAKGESVLTERQLRRPDGTKMWAELSGKAIDGADFTKGIVWMVVDVTARKKALEALEITQYATDQASDLVIWAHCDGRLGYVNQAACRSLGYTREELLDMRVWDICTDLSEDTWGDHWNYVAQAGQVCAMSQTKAKDGTLYPIETHASYHEFGDAKLIFAYARDVSTRVQADAQVRLQVSAMNAASDHIVIMDCDATVVFLNKACEEQTGYSRDEIVGKNISILLPDETTDKRLGEIQAIAGRGEVWSGDLLCQKKNGDSYFSEVTVTPVLNESDQPEYFVAIGRDVTNRKWHEQMLDQRAKQDSLTGLPNRLVFNDTLTAMVSGHRKSDAMFGVMFIDLDRFKSVNDTLGHDAGDLLLVEAGMRLRKCLRETDILCRVGGDEFTVIIRLPGRLEEARMAADRILHELRQPFVIKGHEFILGASIGVSVYPRDAQDFSGLVKSADTAMYRAKELGRNNCQFYGEDMDAENNERLGMERDLRLALQCGQLEVYYQPRIDPVTTKLVGAESLLRWNHPTRGLIPASEFIPLAEETGLILSIGDYVLAAVCEQQKKWQASGLEPVRVAINLSEKHAFRTEFLYGIARRMEENGLSLSLLSLELPGKAFLYISEQALCAIEELRMKGVQFTLDDFSTGPLPLTVLNRIPVDSLKIDTSLMAAALDRLEDIRVVASIVSTARNLGLQVVAVGVETQMHVELAASLMCDSAQGYFIGRPLPAEQFEEFVRTRDENPTRPIEEEAA